LALKLVVKNKSVVRTYVAYQSLNTYVALCNKTEKLRYELSTGRFEKYDITEFNIIHSTHCVFNHLYIVVYLLNSYKIVSYPET
jgi:hypothetical protein